MRALVQAAHEELTSLVVTYELDNARVLHELFEKEPTKEDRVNYLLEASRRYMPSEEEQQAEEDAELAEEDSYASDDDDDEDSDGEGEREGEREGEGHGDAHVLDALRAMGAHTRGS